MTNSYELDKKKRLIAEAAWRVILNQGFEGASVRNIAKEAAISLGSLRYYFSTQEELLEFTEGLAYMQISEAIESIMNEDMEPKDKIIGSLLELIPIGEEASVESKVRMAFILKRKLDASERKERKKEAEMLLKTIFSQLALLNLLRKDLSKSLEFERMQSFIEGLAVRDDSAKEIKNRALLLYHLNSICVENFD